MLFFSDIFKLEKVIWVSVMEISRERDGISVYPNPALDLVTINFQSGLKNVEFSKNCTLHSKMVGCTLNKGYYNNNYRDSRVRDLKT